MNFQTKSQPIILFPYPEKENYKEMVVASRYFECRQSRIIFGKQPNTQVIGRYSVLPNYLQTQYDLNLISMRLINTYAQHQYVANFEYYEDLKDLTFKTWDSPDKVPRDSGPWVLKGRTNSRKFQWDQYMFCSEWNRMVLLYRELMNDPFLGPQGILIRKFEPLEILEPSVFGPPFANEWRFFFIDGQYLCHGYYWVPASRYPDRIPDGGIEFAQEIADRIKDKISFVCIDIALTRDGKWILVELNDGQMSGLSMIEPDALYSGLANYFEQRG